MKSMRKIFENESPAGMSPPRAVRISKTSCHAFAASNKLIYPGFPLRTLKGSSLPFTEHKALGFWCGLHPYLSMREGLKDFTNAPES